MVYCYAECGRIIDPAMDGKAGWQSFKRCHPAFCMDRLCYFYFIDGARHLQLDDAVPDPKR
jgi:hypothetical protein